MTIIITRDWKQTFGQRCKYFILRPIYERLGGAEPEVLVEQFTYDVTDQKSAINRDLCCQKAK